MRFTEPTLTTLAFDCNLVLGPTLSFASLSFAAITVWVMVTDLLDNAALARIFFLPFSIVLTPAEIIRDYYPDLKLDDVRACVQHAIDVINAEEIHVRAA